MYILKVAMLLLIWCNMSEQRIHEYNLKKDVRKQLTLSTFGFLEGGTLSVDVKNFTYRSDSRIMPNRTTFGFTLDRTTSPGSASYLETRHDECALQKKKDKEKKKDASVDVIFFRFDLKEKKIYIERSSSDLIGIEITQGDSSSTKSSIKPSTHVADQNTTATTVNPTTSVTVSKIKRSADKSDAAIVDDSQLKTQLPLIGLGPRSFAMKFDIYITKKEDGGLYNLFFHNCFNFQKDVSSEIDLKVKITEKNGDNYLSAGKMPEPVMFFVFSIFYFVSGLVWLSFLRKAKDETPVYKLHYLMLAVVWVKSWACLLHATNQYFIERNGIHAEAWAILYYIAYLVRGALLFITILLIGAGWAFIKHMLSDKEKKLFLFAIPLQILDNIAWIILEESEEGQSEYLTWRQVFVIIDLICCGAILFPVVWSIRHLQAAAGVDGKAAINLNKLKLFRHFYIMVVCYIYSTRIIVYVFKMTVPFYLVWLDEMFKEIVTIIFFVVTGYKFRPATDNPYLQVPLDSDDEIEMEEVLTESGVLDTVTKVNQKYSEGETQPKQRESSHEYD